MNQDNFNGQSGGTMEKDRELDQATDPEPNDDISPGPDHVTPGLTIEAQDRIAGHLRKVYCDLLAQPMPDKFKKLLDDLAKSEGSND